MTKKSLALILLLGTVLTANHSSLFAMDDDLAAAPAAAPKGLLADLSTAPKMVFTAQAKDLLDLASRLDGTESHRADSLTSAVKAVILPRF